MDRAAGDEDIIARASSGTTLSFKESELIGRSTRFRKDIRHNDRENYIASRKREDYGNEILANVNSTDKLKLLKNRFRNSRQIRSNKSRLPIKIIK